MRVAIVVPLATPRSIVWQGRGRNVPIGPDARIDHSVRLLLAAGGLAMGTMGIRRQRLRLDELRDARCTAVVPMASPPAASMEPRLESRGILIVGDQGRDSLVASMEPRLESRGIVSRVLFARWRLVASMEPRLESRGIIPCDICLDSPTILASMEPRLESRGIGAGIAAGATYAATLQWSRGSKAAESAQRLWCLRQFLWLQWSRGSKAAESRRSRVRQRAQTSLQWSRGSKAAES